MKTRKFLHTIAVIFSSFASMISHGHAAKAEVTAKKAKKSDSELSKAHRNNGGSTSSADASEDPPKKLDPSLMANADRSAVTSSILPTTTSTLAPLPGDEASH